jgi:hypothetical protein
MTSSKFVVAAALAALAGTAFGQGVVAVRAVAIEGQPAPGTGGANILSVNAPTVNGNGQVAFTGNYAGSPTNVSYVFVDNAVVFRNTDPVGFTLGGFETTMGVNNAGQWFVSPSVDGEDSAWTSSGLLARGTEPAPGTGGLFLTFNSRPTMAGSGAAFWVAGTATTSAGTSSGRVFYRVADVASPVFEVLLQNGDTVAGLPAITTTGVAFDFSPSPNARNVIHELLVTATTTTDGVIVKNVGGVYTLLAREGSPVPGGVSGENFGSALDTVAINDDGDTLFSASTSAANPGNEILLFNSTIIAREGQTVGGVLLGGTGVDVTGASLTNSDVVAAIFSYTNPSSQGEEALFLGRGAGFATNARVLLRTRQAVDTTGDGVADWTVTDFNASNGIGPGLRHYDGNPFIFVAVGLTPIGGGTEVDAIIGVPLCAADFNLDGEATFDDIQLFVGAYNAQNPRADLNNDGEWTFDDIQLFVQIFNACGA